MTSEAEDRIKWLARKAATAGLRLKDARDLFSALYIADCLAAAGGNQSRAAELAGVERATLLRLKAKTGTGKLE